MLICVFLAGTSALLISCSDLTSDLEGLNQNPDVSEELNPGHMFANAQLNGVAVNWGHGHLMYGQAMQFFSTHFEVPARGDKYFNESGARGHWSVYADALRQNEEVMKATAEPESVNKHSAARIWRVYLFHQVTDLHGDVPYSDALNTDNIKPKYDRQEDIYLDMLNELEQAANAFDPSSPTFENADLFYGGNIDQWQKFAYSLMLRLGMRLTEVRPDVAEEYVKKAIAGGVITEDIDITRIEYTSGGTENERNPKADFMRSIDYLDPYADNREGGKYAETFIEHLKDTQDPRLSVVSVVWVEDPNNPELLVYDTTPEIQYGMKNGAYFGIPPDFDDMSEPHPNTVLNYGSPVLVMTNAEVYLLLAEAALRGWYTGSSAEDAYTNGVRAAMRQWSRFGNEGVISTDEIEEYLAGNPYNTAGTFEQQLEQISTQKWVSLFLDFYEIFANWRRTGYPELTPTNYPGNITGGTIPRRNIIPDSEEELNQDNFLEAIERQGVGNFLTSTVWWDPMHPSQQLN